MDERGFPLQESQSQSAGLLAPGYFSRVKLLPPSSFVHHDEHKPVPLLARELSTYQSSESSQSLTTKSVRSAAIQVSMVSQQRSFQPSKGNTAREEQGLNNHIRSMPVESIPLGNGLPETGLMNRKSTGWHSPLVCKAEWEGGGGESNPFSLGKSVLLSTGKRLHSSIPSLPTKTKPGQKQDMETAESLKYDNYYNYAAYASAATKREWDYISDEPGEKLFEQSLLAHQSKVEKQLEYYNSVFAKHEQSKQASKPISSQKTALSTPRHRPKLSAGRLTQTSTRSLQGNTLIGTPPIQPKCKTSAPLTSEATTLVPKPLQNIRTAKPLESRALQAPHLAIQTNCDEPPQSSTSQTYSQQSEPSSSGPLEAYLGPRIASGTATGSPAPQNSLASPRRQPQACPAPRNDSSRPPLSQQPREFQPSLQIASGALNNLDEVSDSEDEAPVRCKETGEMTEQPSASATKMPAAATKNDTAIALVLQSEENDRVGKHQASLPTAHATCTSDFEIARRLQQDFDAEIARVLNHRERGMYFSSSDSDTNVSFPSPTRLTHTHNDPPYYERHRRSRRPYRMYHSEQDMTYEALSRLEDVPRGLNLGTITRLTNTYTYEPRTTSDPGAFVVPKLPTEQCSICLMEFETGQMLRSLPCLHRFHRVCIDKWLTQNKNCPVCMEDIIEQTHKNKLFPIP